MKRFALCACVLMGVAACSDPTRPVEPSPETGARVTTTTSGLDIDPDGYGVVVGSSDQGAIPATGTKLIRLEPGSWTIALTGLAPNCTFDGPGSRTVTVVATEVVPVEFVIACTATSGVIGVVTSGNGEGALFEAMVDGATTFPVGSFGPAYLSGVPVGDHVVSLSAPDGCSVETGPQSVTVTAGSLIRDTAQVTFSVVCVLRFGTALAFVSDRDGNTEIYVMNADGSAQTRLTNNPADDSGPQWSPDGQRIAFVSDRDGNTEIYVMNADGSAQTRLTNNPAHDSDPQWSPDGQRIAFSSTRDGNWEVYVMNADGSAQTRLTNNPADDRGPLWSPDGQRIAFVSNRDANTTAYTAEIYVMNADGSTQTRLTTSADLSGFNGSAASSPAWSPDGQNIAFEAGNIFDLVDICVANANGLAQRCLTHLFPGDDLSPVWSPDGQTIAFVSTRDRNREVYAMNANGSAQTRLTNNAAVDRSPRYRP